MSDVTKAHWIIRYPKGKEKQEKPYCYHEDKCSHCGRVFCYDYRDQYDACEDFDFLSDMRSEDGIP